MSKLALLCDIGSTYTKLVAVDLDAAKLRASSIVPTTAENIAVGVGQALTQLKSALPTNSQFVLRRAASSAAGGLNLVAVGLVPELTGEAARMAALGAGAKVLRVFGHGLQAADLAELQILRPDIILLTGGTDGGDSAVLLDNAQRLATARLPAAMVVAGNRNVTPAAVQLPRVAGYEVSAAANVMPRLGQLAVDDVRQAIRSLFLGRIILGKGLKQVEAEFGGQVVMPTPVAVLQGLELLAKSYGELLAVDVGGATTDVYSLASGLPQDDAVIPVGLRPPFCHRTVEADLGLRVSASTVVRQYPLELSSLGEQAEVAVDWVQWAAELGAKPSWVPVTEQDQQQEMILAKTCLEQAVNRHVGRVQAMATPYGRNYLLHGKDLRGVSTVIGIGGVFRQSPYTQAILAGATQGGDRPDLLKPAPGARLLIDTDYVLSAAGLLADSHPDCALQLIKSSLRAPSD